MPFDPFNPDNTAYEANPSSSMINNQGSYGSAPIHPAYARAFATDQFNIPGPQYFTPSSYGVFRPTISPTGPSPFQYATPPSFLQSVAQYSGMLPAPTGQMPIEFQGQAAKGLGLGAMKLGSTVAEFGSSMLAGSMMKRAGYGMASTLVGSTAVGLALTAPLSMMVKRQEKITELQAQTRGLVSSGNDLDPSGRGLSMGASTDLFKQFTSMSTENYRFNRDDLRKLTETGRKAGLFQFSGSSGNEIGKAIKNISDTIVAFSQIVESGSLDEAAQVLGDFQKLGISQKQSSAVGRTMRRFSRMAGVETGELIATGGNVGAEAYVRHGLAGGVGLQVGGMTQGLANSAVRAGAVDPMTLSMLGGVSGYSQMGTNFMADIFGKNFQKMFLPGLVSSKNGKLEFDNKKMKGFLSGKTSMTDMMASAGNLDQHQIAELIRNAPTLMSKGLQGMTPEEQITAVQRVIYETQEMMGPGTTTEEALQASGAKGVEVEGLMTMFFDPNRKREMRESKERQDIEDRHQRRRHRIEENSLYAKSIRGVRKIGAAIESPILAMNQGFNNYLDKASREELDAFSPTEALLGSGRASDIDFLLSSGSPDSGSTRKLNMLTGKAEEIGITGKSATGMTADRTSFVRNTFLNRLIGGVAATNEAYMGAAGLQDYSGVGDRRGILGALGNAFGGRVNEEDYKNLKAAADAGDPEAKRVLRNSIGGFGTQMTGGNAESVQVQSTMAANAIQLSNISDASRDDLASKVSSGGQEKVRTSVNAMRRMVRDLGSSGASQMMYKLKRNMLEDLNHLSGDERALAIKDMLATEEMREQTGTLSDAKDQAMTIFNKNDVNLMSPEEKEALVKRMGGKQNYGDLLDYASENKLSGKGDIKDAVMYGRYLNAGKADQEAMIKRYGGDEAFNAMGDRVAKTQEQRDRLRAIDKKTNTERWAPDWMTSFDEMEKLGGQVEDSVRIDINAPTVERLKEGFGSFGKDADFASAAGRKAFSDRLISSVTKGKDESDEDYTARRKTLLEDADPMMRKRVLEAADKAKSFTGPRQGDEDVGEIMRASMGVLGDKDQRLANIMGAAESVKLDPLAMAELSAINSNTAQLAQIMSGSKKEFIPPDVNKEADNRASSAAYGEFATSSEYVSRVIGQR